MFGVKCDFYVWLLRFWNIIDSDVINIVKIVIMLDNIDVEFFKERM